MKKYVLKEDVEKGLVDPNKPLDQQPEYKQKVDQEALEKQKLHEAKNPPQHQRVRKERPPRKERPKFNWDKKEITLETKVLDQPKKILQKPNKEKFIQGLNKLKAQRETLNQEKKALFEEQRALIKDISESKKTGKMAITQFTGAMREKFNTENELRRQIRALDQQKVRVNNQIEALKEKAQAGGQSIQWLRQKIAQKQHYLTTGDIDKRQETKLNNEINELKRALQKARPSIQIQSELSRYQDQVNILWKELKGIKHELHVKITQANAIKAELSVLKTQKSSEQGQVEMQRSVQDIKAEFDAKIKAAEDRRDKLQDKIDDHSDKFTRQNDDYEDQQDLLRYIKYVQDQIEWLKKKKEEDEKRQKEKEEYEKRKLKEKEEYEKRKEERKKYEEQKKAREQERKIRLEKERETYINRNPNFQEIDLCENLIGYCQSLKPNNNLLPLFGEKVIKPVGQIKFGKEWQKELKGGAVIVESKKSKLDQEIPKKAQKQPKKKEEKPEDENYIHGIQTINQFQKLKLLPPLNIAQIDSTIKLIQDKLALYQSPTEEEKAAFREKSTKDFDERNGLRDADNKAYKQKRESEGEHVKAQKSQKPKRKEKKQLSEQDFPGLA